MSHRLLLALVVLVPLPAMLASGCDEGSGTPRKADAGGPVVLVYEQAASDSPNAAGWIWRANANGSDPKRLIRGGRPSISPDGQTIAFIRARQIVRGQTGWSVETLWLARSDGSHARAIADNKGGFTPIVWSADSRHLLAAGSDGLQLIDPANDRLRPLPGTKPAVNASFSPDGRSIAYERGDGAGNNDIFVLSTGGGTPRQLTTDHRSYGPLWGPSRIAYVRFSGGFRDGDIWLIDGDGSNNERLTRTAASYFPAAWSRDGRRLLGANPATHNGRLWAIEVPSGHARPLTDWTGDLFPQGFSRDGRRVYAAIGCGGTVSPLGLLETIPFSGGQTKVISRGPCRGSWSA